jgi:hypothetical protein
MSTVATSESFLEKYWIYFAVGVLFAILVILAFLLSLFIGRGTKKLPPRRPLPFYEEDFEQ